MKEKFLSIIYDHWITILSIFGVGIFSWLKIQIPIIANYPVQLWVVCIIIILTICIVLYIKTPKIKSLVFDYKKPIHIYKEYGKKILFKVDWEVFMGHDDDFSDRRIWVSGPFCPECIYALDEDVDKWICVTCNKKYKIPYNIRICPKEKIVKIFEAKAKSASGLEKNEDEN